jgi:hypothetical protein
LDEEEKPSPKYLSELEEWSPYDRPGALSPELAILNGPHNSEDLSS